MANVEAEVAALGHDLVRIAEAVHQLSVPHERESTTLVLRRTTVASQMSDVLRGKFADGWTYQCEIPTPFDSDQRLFILTRQKR